MKEQGFLNRLAELFRGKPTNVAKTDFVQAVFVADPELPVIASTNEANRRPNALQIDVARRYLTAKAGYPASEILDDPLFNGCDREGLRDLFPLNGKPLTQVEINNLAEGALAFLDRQKIRRLKTIEHDLNQEDNDGGCSKKRKSVSGQAPIVLDVEKKFNGEGCSTKAELSETDRKELLRLRSKALTSSDLVSLALGHGFVHDRTNGDHAIYLHPDGRMVNIPLRTQHADVSPNVKIRTLGVIFNK